jgi:DNA-binding transcriptional LysR family regulator
VLTDRSGLTEGRDHDVLSPRVWRLGDLGARHAMLLAGFGWGKMPHHMVADDLAQGRLVALRAPELERDGRVRLSIFATTRADRVPGPAARWLIDHFVAATVASRNRDMAPVGVASPRS